MKPDAAKNLPASSHRQILIICSLAIAASPLLQVLPDERVAVRGMDELPLPPSCPSRVLFKANCPGCGLTRSFVHLAHGNWRQSLRVHRVGWLVMLLVASQVPYRVLVLWKPERFQVGRRVGMAIVVATIVLIFGNWIVGLL